jgi:hypothetical protein
VPNRLATWSRSADAAEMPDLHEKTSETLPVEVKRRDGRGLLTGGDRSINRMLTRKERAVLRVICDPALCEATQAERAKQAQVSIRQYFSILADPWFREQHRVAINRHVQERVGRLIEAGYQTAATPGRDGFQDRRMLLEMTGHYVKREQIDHTSGGQPIVGVIGVAMDDI